MRAESRDSPGFLVIKTEVSNLESLPGGVFLLFLAVALSSAEPVSTLASSTFTNLPSLLGLYIPGGFLDALPVVAGLESLTGFPFPLRTL